MEKKITALKVQKRNPNRVNVFLDGEYAFGLARVVAAWLQPGQLLDSAKIETLLAQDSHEVAYQRCLRFIAVRPRSEAEVRLKLAKLGFNDELVGGVVATLKSKRYLDDAEFARIWIENRTTFRPRSRRMMSMELKQKGVIAEVVEDALESSPIDENILAYDLAKKYSRRLQGIDKVKFKMRLSAYLARRGFFYSVSAPIVEQMYQDHYINNNIRFEKKDGDDG